LRSHSAGTYSDTSRHRQGLFACKQMMIAANIMIQTQCRSLMGQEAAELGNDLRSHSAGTCNITRRQSQVN
jgi:hypothetical protein